jgi:hypothetical protein
MSPATAILTIHGVRWRADSGTILNSTLALSDDLENCPRIWKINHEACISDGIGGKAAGYVGTGWNEWKRSEAAKLEPQSRRIVYGVVV